MLIIHKRHPLSEVDYDNWDYLLGIIPGVIADNNKPPKSPSSTAPSLPNESTASTTASTTVASNRATLLASGGQTDETGGLGILTGSDVSTTSLIGG